MRKFFIVVLILFGKNAFSQDYLFAASYLPQGKDCMDQLLYTTHYSEGQHHTAEARFRAEKKPQASDILKIPKNEYTIIYSYRRRTKGFTCEYTVYAVASGNTKEEAMQKMYSATKDDDIAVRHSPKPELFLDKSVIEKKDSSTVKKDKKDIGEKISKRNYFGVEVEYSIDGSKSVIVKGKNTSKNLIATIVFETMSGFTIREKMLKPGESFSEKIGESSFNFIMTSLEFAAGKPSKEKEKIIDKISTETGDVKHSFPEKKN